ncbi:type II toxin-antitoxin system RelE/ParE family toxin [Desertibaculum subflavum]|uniref:type II toxin-antitoxin system RelE/ParE family toxin n=1 Tax=Desertibaculum subflavum TaxID=2268458 RepID=UPI000E66D1C2
MLELIASNLFTRWLDGLRDRQGRAVILARLARVEAGQFGDAKPVGGGVSELRIAFGPGYRVYFARRGATIVLLLAGGDKSSQARDIARAKRVAAEWKD